MSLWWTKKNELDPAQIKLIEDLPTSGNFLITGPPGSGKTNVLLRRAQFLRNMGISNIQVLTFTRPLTEFVKTGCYDNNSEIFPPSCVNTIESWIRELYESHDTELPPESHKLQEWKRALASGAAGFRAMDLLPPCEVLFVDEAQDLLEEEVTLFRDWAENLFFVGDDRQQIYDSDGLRAVRRIVSPDEKKLEFHYRLAPEICKMADKIRTPSGGGTLESSCHYKGPTPSSIVLHDPCSQAEQLEIIKGRLKAQIRLYGGFIDSGDRFGVVVARQADRELIFNALESDPDLAERSQILRSRYDGEQDYEPAVDTTKAISIVTVQGCKGIEFRGVHWFNSDDLEHYRTSEHYYTVVTRAKTLLDIYCENTMPGTIAKAYSQQRGVPKW